MGNETQNNLILEQLMEMNREMGEMKKTMNNGLSHKTAETHAMLTTFIGRFENYEKNERFASCPYIKDQTAKKSRLSDRARHVLEILGMLGTLVGIFAGLYGMGWRLML